MSISKLARMTASKSRHQARLTKVSPTHHREYYFQDFVTHQEPLFIGD